MIGDRQAIATIYPNNPVGALSPEIVKVFRLLKRLPDDAYAIWQRLAIWSEPGPDFWVRNRSGRSLQIKVSLATTQDARSARQGSFFADTRQAFGLAEQAALQRFLGMLDTSDGQFGTEQVPALICIDAGEGGQASDSVAPRLSCVASTQSDYFAIWES